MISQTAEYALRAMVCLASHDPDAVTNHTISSITQVPGSYLHKVLKQLVQAGLLDSQRGPSGGFRLSRSPEEITVFDVIQAVDPVRRIHTCPLNLPEHARELCPLHKHIDDTMAHACEVFKKATLQSMVSSSAAVKSPLGQSD